MAFAKLRRGFETLMEIVVVGLLLVLAIIVILGIIYRVANNPFTWYDEVASVLLAWLTYYGAALAALKRAHIGFPGLVERFPPAIRLPLALIAESCVLIFFGLLAWYGWIVLGLLAGDTLVSVPIPVELTQSVMPVGAVLFIVAELLVLPDIIRAARTGVPEPHEGIAAEVGRP